MAASLGLVPRQNSSGGKSKLGRISKRGDPYIRQLMVHGARSVLKVSHRHDDKYNLWVILSKQKETFNPQHIGVKTILH